MNQDTRTEEKPPNMLGHTVNALRIWGQHDLADHFVSLLLQLPVLKEEK